MTPSLSKLQLDTVLSALDGQPRNPNSKDAALKRIARHGEQLGLSRDDLLMAAAGLLDGRMDAAAFIAALKEASPGAPQVGQKMETEEVTPEEASNAGAAQQLDGDGPAPLVDGAPCPLCGRTVRRSRHRDAHEPGLHRHRDGSKEAQVIEMLRRPEGATIAQIIAATGWVAHTVRGVFAGALKKRHGLTVISEKPAGQERTYRIG